MNGAMTRLASSESCGRTSYPRSQSPMVTLLRKKREGQIPKGALYIDTDLSLLDSVKKKPQQVQLQRGVRLEVTQTKEIVIGDGKKGTVGVTSSSSWNGSNGKDGLPQNQPTVDEKIREWNQKMADQASTHNAQSSAPGGLLTSKKSPTRPAIGDGQDIGRPVRIEDKGQPMRIEDYEPGRSSIALREGSEYDAAYYNPPVVKPGNFCRYTESDTEVEYRIRRKDQPLSPTLSDVHELYRSVQRGGHIPPPGIKIPQESRIGHSLSETSSQFYNPRTNLPPESPTTIRQQRDRENARRRVELERIVAEEKRKKLLLTDQENAARRHCDFFTPSQKSLVALNRYSDDDGDMDNLVVPMPRGTASALRQKIGSKVKGRAKALYTFRAQNSRELSFRKGDTIYLLRQVDRNWFKGERHGVVGIFPISYVEVTTSLDEAQAIAADGEGLARALYNFAAQTSLELSLRKGDIVKLIRRVDENWYEGRFGNSRRGGIFPVRYVETLMEPSPSTFNTPMSSRTCTPLFGSPGGAVSPSCSIYSMGPAPTIPSAPMSPAESEIFDELQFSNAFLSTSRSAAWCSSPGRWAANYRPASAASRHHHRTATEDGRRGGETGSAEAVGGGAYYYSSSGLDGIGFSAQPQIAVANRCSVDRGGFARNVKCIANAYQFDERAEMSIDVMTDEERTGPNVQGQSVQGEVTTSRGQVVQDDVPTSRSQPVEGEMTSGSQPVRGEINTISVPTKEEYTHLRYPPYRTLYAYIPVNSDELELQVGDVIYVVEQCADGWFVGTSDRTKEFGTFPGNYVEPMR